MKKELQIVTRMSGFQAKIGEYSISNTDRCHDCIGLQCNSCHPIYELNGARVPVTAVRSIIASERR